MLRLLRNLLMVLAAPFIVMASGAAWSACTQQTIDFGQTRNGVIATDDCVNNSNNAIFYYDSYIFNGVAGQRIAVTMTTTSSVDPFMFLVYPDRTFVSDNNSGGGVNARIPATGFLTLTQTGVHEIQALTAAAGQTGSYTLSLTSSTPAACSVAANPQSSATLPLARGTAVTISAVCGSGATPFTYTWDSGAFVGAARTVTPTQTTTYSIVASNANGSSPPFTITVYVASPPPPGVPTVEFYNINLAHYFVTAVQAEASAIDNGSAGPGWVRTGFSYDVYNGPVSSGSINTVPVCRFYGTPGKGPNSHFYTADATECEQVKKDPGWFYEGIAYHIQPWLGTCPADTLPIYRTYNNRAATNDSNHRFITNANTFQQMSDKGWIQEGIVMCSPSARAPTPVLGGTFTDPSRSGASVAIAPGELPPYVNATQPQISPASQPPGGMVNPQIGDTNVTAGGGGYTFNLTGDGGFTSGTAPFNDGVSTPIQIAIPFNAAGIPAVDAVNPIKTFVRVQHPSGSIADLTGTIQVSGATGLVTVSSQGLPGTFIAAVIYNPNMDVDTGDPGTVDIPALIKSGTSTNATVWPGRGWCTFYNPRDPSLIVATQNVLGLARAPTPAEIKSVIHSRVSRYALLAQMTYQNDGMGAPNMGTGLACGGTTRRYYLHMLSLQGSFFRPDDPGAATDKDGRKYGRLYIDPARLDDEQNTVLGTSLASIAHEMFHGVQDGYIAENGTSIDSYFEGTAAVYGKSIDTGGALTVRNEMTFLDIELLESTEGSPNKYGSEDFWAYVANVYNGGKLTYFDGLFKALRVAFGTNTPNPAKAAAYGVLDGYLNTTFKKSLPDIYMDFVRDRALTHPQAAQLRVGENTVGLSNALFRNARFTETIDVSTCAANTVSFTRRNYNPFTSFVITLNPVGNLPANSNGVTLQIKTTPTNGTTGTTWRGWSYRNNAATAITSATARFPLWGKAGDPLVVIFSNIDRTTRGNLLLEINCGGPHIDSLAPNRGKATDVVTINGSGFGAAADARTVTFNSVAATAVTRVSDTQLRATVPANASTGDVVVTVSGDKSNGVNFEVVSACSAQQVPGGDTPDTRTIELGKTSGTFIFTYETYAQEDQMIVRYQGAPVFTSACVGTRGARKETINFNGTSTSIEVQVIPNCARPGTGTQWYYTVSCP